MLNKKIRTVTTHCYNCKNEVPVSFPTYLNTLDYPDLKKRILAGERVDAYCPLCGEPVYPQSNILYHDPEKKVLILIARDGWSAAYADIMEELHEQELFDEAVRETLGEILIMMHGSSKAKRVKDALVDRHGIDLAKRVMDFLTKRYPLDVEAGIMQEYLTDCGIDCESLEGYKKRIVYHEGLLWEKVEAFENGLDDRVTEFIKLLLESAFRERYPQVAYSRSIYHVHEDGKHSVKFIGKRNGKSFVRNYRFDASYYETMQARCALLFADSLTSDIVDADWVKRVLTPSCEVANPYAVPRNVNTDICE